MSASPDLLRIAARIAASLVGAVLGRLVALDRRGTRSPDRRSGAVPTTLAAMLLSAALAVEARLDAPAAAIFGLGIGIAARTALDLLGGRARALLRAVFGRPHAEDE